MGVVERIFKKEQKGKGRGDANAKPPRSDDTCCMSV